MISVVSGTNRPGSNTRKVAGLAVEQLEKAGAEAKLLDLADLPVELFDGASYAEKPTAFEPFQDAILAAHGVVTVIPEYNGSFPGAVKYFIDMLRFPESLYEKPAAFVGLSAGPWGAVRGVEQLEMVFQYRHAHLFGRRVFVPNVSRAIDDCGRFADEVLGRRFEETLGSFVEFCRKLTR